MPRIDPWTTLQATESGCLLWQGAKHKQGYGVCRRDGTICKAHRVAWEAEHGAIPDGMVLHHTCHQKNCVNVNHLRLHRIEEGGGVPLGQVAVCRNGHEYVRGGQGCQRCKTLYHAAWVAAHPERVREQRTRYDRKRPSRSKNIKTKDEIRWEAYLNR